MYRKGAILVTFNTLRTLTKVCRTPNSYLYSAKSPPFCRSLSSAPERSDCFATTNEFNGESYQNNNDFQFQQNGNVNSVYGKNPRNEFQHNPDGKDRNFSSEYVGNGQKDGFFEDPVRRQGTISSVYMGGGQTNGYFEHPVGKSAIFGGYNVNMSSGYTKNGVQNGGFENPAGKNATFDGYSGVNSNDMWQQNAYGYVRERSVDLQHDWSGGHGQGAVDSLGGGIGGHGDVSGGFQQTMSGYSGGIYGNSQQNSYGSYTQNMGMPQQSSSNYSTGNAGNAQYAHGSFYTGNSGMYHESAGISSGYNNVGGYQQGLSSGSVPSAGYYQQSSNQSQNVNVGTQGETSVKSNEESLGVAEESELRGTIEDLDKFLEEGKPKEAVKVLGLLEEQHISVDLARYLILMKACGEDNALEEAKVVHEHLVKSEVQLQLKTYNKILDMYCRCDSMNDAFRVFDKMPRRNLTTWDIMISWLGKNGHGEDAIELFTQFKEMGLRPDGKMFFGVFTACSILGDTIEGLLHFDSMSKDFGIVPSMEHYVSVVDMLGSTGQLDEALEFIEKMPMDPSVEVWETLMNLCRMHGNLELGDYCAERVELVDPSRLNEQASAGLIPVKPSDLAKGKENKKLTGQSLLEARSRVHEYRAGDRSSPEHEKLYALLRGMKQQMKEAGYIPETKFVLHDIDLEGKEEALMAHSERLAVAQGLLTTPARNPIRIIKNLRICVDCHNAMKIISKLVGRELIIRDAKRFHHFRDGLCSCRDYW